MENRKGFTLIELLVTITIIGIIMLMVLPAITSLQRENQKKKFDDYERAVLEAAKAYEDQYEEDLFGRYSEGCAYIDYKNLVDKKLLSTTKISGYECNYDTNGIIIRKVNGKSFYEVYLDCVKGSETKKLTNNSGYKSISRDYCDVGEDKTPPTLEIKCDGETDDNPTYRTGIQGDDTHLYYRGVKRDDPVILPNLTVKASDANSGLEKNQYVSYEWKVYLGGENQDKNNPSSTEKNKTTFNTKDGAGSTAKKKVRIIEALKQENETGIAIVDLYGDNIIDRAGNKREGVSKNCTFYYDNARPQMNITITGASGRNYNPKGNAWIREPITTTVTITDQTANNIYSGIKTDTFTSDADSGAKLSEDPPTHTYSKPDDNREHLDEYTVCDKVGNCYSDTANIRVDTTPPECGATSTSASTPWINQDRTVTVDCSDNLSGCTQDTYSKTFGNDGTTEIITIRDNAGNTTNCTVYTKVDKTKPNCTSSGGDDHWRNTPLKITGTCNDELSGCAQPTYTNNYPSEISITNGYGGRACDVAGNCRDCTKDQDVHIDTTNPSCEFFDIQGENIAGQWIVMQVRCTDDKALKICGHDEVGVGAWNSNVHTLMTNTVGATDGDMVRDVWDMAGNFGQCRIHISVTRCTSSCCGTHKCNCDADGNNCSRCNNTCTRAECCGYHVG